MQRKDGIEKCSRASRRANIVTRQLQFPNLQVEREKGNTTREEKETTATISNGNKPDIAALQYRKEGKHDNFKNSETVEPPLVLRKVYVNGCGVIQLNRPRSLNAINGEIVRLVLTTLIQWAEDKRVRFVLLMGAGKKAFCAGGYCCVDVRVLVYI
jgi:hypothetical protein